jgi:hypothetical protein
MFFTLEVRYDRPHDQILTWFIDGVLVPLIHFSSLIDRYLQQLVEYDKWYTQLGRRVLFQDLISRRMPATSAAVAHKECDKGTLFVGELKRRLFEYFGMHDSSWPFWIGNFDKWTTKVFG